MNPLTPYLMWIKIGIAGAVLGVVFFAGRGCGVKAEEGRTAKVQVQLDGARASLAVAATALRQAATTLQGISDATEAEVIRARENAKAGQDAANAAAKDAKASADRAASLEKKLLAERTGCVDGNRPICGVPLR